MQESHHDCTPSCSITLSLLNIRILKGVFFFVLWDLRNVLLRTSLELPRVTQPASEYTAQRKEYFDTGSGRAEVHREGGAAPC